MGTHGRICRLPERVQDADCVGFVGQFGDFGGGGPVEGGYLVVGGQAEHGKGDDEDGAAGTLVPAG